MADMSDVDTMAKGDVRCVNADEKGSKGWSCGRKQTPSRPLGAILIAVSEVAVEVGIDASRQSTFWPKQNNQNA